MAEVRGASILGTIEYIKEHFGAEAPEAVFGALKPDVRSALGDATASRILTTGWYDYRVLTDLSREMDRRYGSGDLALARACGKYVAFQDMNRFFKWMLRLTGPSTVFTRAASVWNNYHNTGRYVVENVGPDRASIRVEDWGSVDPIMCRRIEGWMERALELTLGTASQPRIHELFHRRHDPHVSAEVFCRFQADWSERGPGGSAEH